MLTEEPQAADLADPRASTQRCPPSSCPQQLGGHSRLVEDRVLEVMRALRLPLGVPCKLLTTGERIRLLVAMELVTDPPALFLLLSDALRDLESQVGELASLLHHLTRTLGSQSFCSSTAPRLLSLSDSSVLFWVEGRQCSAVVSRTLHVLFHVGMPATVLGTPAYDPEKQERRRRRLEVGSVIDNSCEPNPSFSAIMRHRWLDPKCRAWATQCAGLAATSAAACGRSPNSQTRFDERLNILNCYNRSDGSNQRESQVGRRIRCDGPHSAVLRGQQPPVGRHTMTAVRRSVTWSVPRPVDPMPTRTVLARSLARAQWRRHGRGRRAQRIHPQHSFDTTK